MATIILQFTSLHGTLYFLKTREIYKQGEWAGTTCAVVNELGELLLVQLNIFCITTHEGLNNE